MGAVYEQLAVIVDTSEGCSFNAVRNGTGSNGGGVQTIGGADWWVHWRSSVNRSRGTWTPTEQLFVSSSHMIEGASN